MTGISDELFNFYYQLWLEGDRAGRDNNDPAGRIALRDAFAKAFPSAEVLMTLYGDSPGHTKPGRIRAVWDRLSEADKADAPEMIRVIVRAQFAGAASQLELSVAEAQKLAEAHATAAQKEAAEAAERAEQLRLEAERQTEHTKSAANQAEALRAKAKAV